MRIGFGYMFQHIGDHAAYVLIRRRVIDLFSPSLPPEDTSCTQQAEMMTDERVGEAEVYGDIAHARRCLQASENDAEPAWVSHQAKHLSEFGCEVLADLWYW